MHATLLATLQRLTSETAHHAFTSICRWQGRYYVAYRVAPSHAILPQGYLHIHTSVDGDNWEYPETITHPHGDLRDPKFFPTQDLLYLMCGAYLPSPHLAHYGIDSLVSHSSDNQIWTLLTYTRDGTTWGPLTPILNPNQWGWSAVITPKLWSIASYGTNVLGVRNTLTLWAGLPSRFVNVGTIYDGASLEREQGRYLYTHSMPSEPVLYQPAPDVFACFARTESTMLHGVCRTDKRWRWTDTRMRVHPSAIIQTLHGWLLAGRELTAKKGKKTKLDYETMEDVEASVVLYHVDANRYNKVLTLPGSGDCAYASLCEGAIRSTYAAEYIVSYYSSHEAPHPCSDVYVARVRIAA